MRAHTASGTGPTLAFAPPPTAAWFAGNRVRGSAPACGTGASLVLAGGVARVGRQGPVWRRVGAVRWHRGVLRGDLSPGRHRDLWNHTAAHREPVSYTHLTLPTIYS